MTQTHKTITNGIAQCKGSILLGNGYHYCADCSAFGSWDEFPTGWDHKANAEALSDGLSESPYAFRCESDTWDPDGAIYSSDRQFRAMCFDVFGEKPNDLTSIGRYV